MGVTRNAHGGTTNTVAGPPRRVDFQTMYDDIRRSLLS